MSDAPPLVVAGLRKVYGDVVAVDDVGFTVGPGEAVGLLGPNGAGKTTTVKALVGLVTPTAGRAELFGLPGADPAARRRIGYLPELFRFPEWLSGRQVLDVHGRLAGVPGSRLPGRIDEVVAQVGLAGRDGERVRGYSKGMTQRLGQAEPDLVLLDEPTSALDPLGRRLVREVIRSLVERGTAVLLNSHLLSEVESVCDRVVILDRGRVRYSGPITEVVRAAVVVRVAVEAVDARLIAALAPFGEVAAADDRTVRVHLPDDASVPDLAAAVVGSGHRLRELVVEQRSLEDAYVQLVTESDQ